MKKILKHAGNMYELLNFAVTKVQHSARGNIETLPKIKFTNDCRVWYGFA